MWAMRTGVAISLLFVSGLSFADPPAAPVNLKEAESQGLQRVSMDELKQYIPGTVMSFGPTGKHKKTYKEDGTVFRKGFMGKEGNGTWRFDEQNNAYCNTFREKHGMEEGCFAVFKAPDGKNFFDYQLDTGFYAHTWHKAKDE